MHEGRCSLKETNIKLMTMHVCSLRQNEKYVNYINNSMPEYDSSSWGIIFFSHLKKLPTSPVHVSCLLCLGTVLFGGDLNLDNLLQTFEKSYGFVVIQQMFVYATLCLKS